MSATPSPLAQRALRHQEAGESAQAEAIWRHLVATEPSNALARFHLGTILGGRERFAEAETLLAEAASLAPHSAEVLGNLGLIRHRLGRLDAAVEDYRRAVALRPDLPMLRNNLATALQELGLVEEAADLYRRLSNEVDDPTIGANLLTALNLVVATPDDALAAARHWAARYAEPVTPPRQPRPATEAKHRLRIGYFGAAGFCRHSLAMTWLPLLSAHDRERFDVFAYSELPEAREDAISRRFQAVAQWRRTLGLSDTEFADAVRADGIDILVDANGFAAGSRMLAFARRPAQIQIHFPTMSTTGMSAMDYVVGDARLFPPALDASFSETLWRLPHAYLYAPIATLPQAAPPPVLRNGIITFGSFNRLSKIGRMAVTTWARVLRAVPQSRLIVKSATGVPPSAQSRMLELFAAHDVAAERVEFRGQTKSDSEHFLQFKEVDVVLDTMPHCGVTTTFDALALGVPVISLAGARPLERYGAVILGALGLDEYLADSPEDYVARAVAMASDVERLSFLRGTLRDRVFASPLCDGAGFTRTLEDAYQAMWNARGTGA